MAQKKRAKAAFDPVKDSGEVFHYFDPTLGAVGISPSERTQEDFAHDRMVPLTRIGSPCKAIPYELVNSQQINVGKRQFPIGMLPRLTRHDYHVVLSETAIGSQSIVYMRLGAKPFKPFMELPANEQIAHSEPDASELKVTAANVVQVAQGLRQGRSVAALIADGRQDAGKPAASGLAAAP